MRCRVPTAWLAPAIVLPLVLPTQTFAGAPTVPPIQECTQSVHDCVAKTLRLLNRDRFRFGLSSLRLSSIQSRGDDACAGAFGHSIAMAGSGFVWDANTSFPRTSFPANMCVRYHRAGENVGEASSGNLALDIHIMNRIMMREPHDPITCAGKVTHACNILSPAFHQVGIGVYVTHGTTWLTENFMD